MTGGDQRPSSADERMADLLGKQDRASLRRELQQESSQDSEDLLSRFNALDFVASIVGDVGDMPVQLGPYRITGLLGRGGMGSVYLAFQADLEREVALKVLSPAFSADPTMRQRFRVEARATAALHHRHIVPIYDYGEAQGCMFYAMERVDGLSLDKVIAAARRGGKRPLPPIEAARRFAGVADALGLAHRRRLLHRDVKPGNVLVANDGTLALTDFGLAKALDQGSVQLTSKGGGFLGTLHYSAPEQAFGGELTPASDLYSLGVTLFEAVTGELPIEGKTTEAILQSILHGTPRRLREVMPKPPRDLELVLDKLLSREPAERYQDGEELARDLQRIADGEPVHIRRQPILLRVYRRARRQPVLAGAILAATVLLLLTVMLLFVVRREQGQSRLSRFEAGLVRVLALAKNAPGSAFGPADWLPALIGMTVPAAADDGGLPAAVESIRRDNPSDDSPNRLWQAYADDQLPTATLLLREGRGHEAVGLYDGAIADMALQHGSDDLTVDLRLHSLYLGRAIANLTHAVARPDAAVRDLTLATFLRPGARFPRVLSAMLEVTGARDKRAALEALERRRDQFDADERHAIGLLLRAAAGGVPADFRNLMDFEMPSRDRRALEQFAAVWLETAAQQVPVPPANTRALAEVLRRVAGEALQSLGQTEVLQGRLTNAAVILDRTLAADSPLQAWRAVFALLDVRAVMVTGPDGFELAPLHQARGWELLLSLQPARDLIEALRPRFDSFVAQNPGLPGLVRVTAQLQSRLGAADALPSCQQWVAQDVEDPAALLCRLETRLWRGELDAALDDAMVIWQLSAAGSPHRRRVVDLFERQALRDGAPARTQELAEWFRRAEG